MKKYTYIEPDEKITGITKKIKAIPDHEINLVLPAKSAMSSLAGLRQLREQVSKLKKKVVIISNDDNVINNAKSAGFNTKISGSTPDTATTVKKSSPDDSKIVKTNRKDIKIVYKKKPTEKVESAPPVDMKKISPAKSPVAPSLANQILLGALSIISLIIIVTVVLLIIPTTTIKLISQARNVNLETTLSVDTAQKNVDYINNVIPAQLINSEQEYVQEERSTGSTNLGQPASGVITVHNQTSSELSLVSNTRFLSDGGVLFRSTQSVKVPADGTANVTVTSDLGGASNNIGPSRFTLPALPGSESYLYGQSTASMSGGTDDIIYNISQDDINFSVEEIKSKLYDQAISDLKTKLPANREFLTIDLADLTVDITPDHQVGDQVDTFNIVAKGTIPFIVYDKANLDEIISKNLAKLVSQDRTMADQGSQNMTIDVLQVDVPSGYALLKITTQAVSIPSYNINQIKKDIAGKSAEEVKEYFLNYPEIQQIDVEFWPDWVNRVSKIPARIDIQISW